MAPSRPIWSGHIRLSLVSFAVKLYPATTSTSKLSFHQVHEPSGKRIRYEKVVPGIGPVDRDEIVRGYEVEKDSYVLLSQEEIDEIRIEARRTLDLVQFVEACEIDPIYFDRPYYVVPDDALAEDAFRVLREALRQGGKVGLGQLVMRGREYIGALKPCSRGLLLETLRFDEELRKSDPYFSEIGDEKPDKELLSLAQELVERKTGPFDASAFHDAYGEALKELVETKAKGRKGTVAVNEEAAPQGEVVDLMAALKKSLGETRKRGGRRRSRARKAA
ncbi:DNA end-binding protein Ku [Tistlia consotensis]|uniref:Non-homologous end joining protein Ku n=1 Tax=Tistlia consotensis USBA 355 TaxID=560819 RepID=A0A1Y6CVK0_9PROT|nr:Ku protein [Tistlia consotensis]SMF80357.1 DNA end-binding protein Ku [Tistlia consotensis USBA 355]SNR62581.1 DNA end-binding protein Ku [Tistlia consotensis]